MKKAIKERASERGGAGVKVLLVFVVLFLAGNAAYNYVPVAYEGASFKQEMETAVVQGSALPGNKKPADIIKTKLLKAASSNNIPPDLWMEIKPSGAFYTAHVIYSKQVSLLPFGMYVYDYEFDHTASVSGFLEKG